MSNTIEEFVIKFITDAKEAKKGASDLDKFLDSVGKKQAKRTEASNRVENKAHQTMLAKKLKAEAVYGRDSKIQAEKARKEWERREKLKSLMPDNKLSNKNAQGSASVFEKEFERKEKAVNKVTKALEKQAAMIRRSAGYKLYRKHGQESGINSQIADLVSKRDLEGLTSLRYKMSDARENMAKYSREVRKATVIQKGFSDSTRNMVRSFASVYAVVEGTRAIKNVGQSFQGMEASMLAASGTASAAAHDMSFINGIVNEMGLNLQDTTDAFVKFKFAAKGKISQGEQEDLFKSLSMFGTALKVDSEAMKRSQKALIQIDEYCLAA